VICNVIVNVTLSGQLSLVHHSNGIKGTPAADFNFHLESQTNGPELGLFINDDIAVVSTV